MLRSTFAGGCGGRLLGVRVFPTPSMGLRLVSHCWKAEPPSSIPMLDLPAVMSIPGEPRTLWKPLFRGSPNKPAINMDADLNSSPPHHPTRRGADNFSPRTFFGLCWRFVGRGPNLSVSNWRLVALDGPRSSPNRPRQNRRFCSRLAITEEALPISAAKTFAQRL